MRRFSYFLPFLLLAGVASVEAQPYIKITTATGECDVTPPPGGEIFRLDDSGNVLISGTMGTPVNTGCSGGGSSGGGTGTVTFNPISPTPFPLTLTPDTFTAGSGSSSASYSAAYATSCTVTSAGGTPTPSGSGSCPALTISNAACSGSTNCSGNGTITEPTALSGPTSCAYNVTATCQPGGVTSTAVLTVSKDVVTPPPGTCPNLARIGTGAANQYWTQVTSTSVKFGDGTVKSGVNATDYVDMWSYPGNTTPWPGSTGLTTRPSASVNMYFAEKFTTPASLVSHPNWAFSGSGINSNMSLTISTCPGDFGQTGSQLTAGCKVDMSSSSNGLTAIVSSTQVGGACTLLPNTAYYLNVLPMASLPVGDITTSTCSGTCTPWLGRN